MQEQKEAGLLNKRCGRNEHYDLALPEMKGNSGRFSLRDRIDYFPRAQKLAAISDEEFETQIGGAPTLKRRLGASPSTLPSAFERKSGPKFGPMSNASA